MKQYKGSCHCGAVQFEVMLDPSQATYCNCSICKKKGAIYAATSDDALTFINGKDDLTLYQFGTHTAKHYFCKTCGIHPLARPRIALHLWVVNLNCIDEIEPTALNPQTFDGKNWEQSAKALLRKTAN